MKSVKIIPKGDAKHRVSTEIEFISYLSKACDTRPKGGAHMVRLARGIVADAPKLHARSVGSKGLERIARRPRKRTIGARRRGRLAQTQHKTENKYQKKS